MGEHPTRHSEVAKTHTIAEDMQRYEVTLSRSSLLIRVQAFTPHSAVQTALQSCDDQGVIRAESVEVVDEPDKGWHVVGTCESCERPILDDEKYGSDEEGCYACHRCLPKES